MTTNASSRRPERIFFISSALLFAAFVLIGFWRTYFRAGAAALPSLLVHVHAILMVGWIVLVLCQVGLISTRKVKWHQQLGTAMAFWAGAILLIGPPTLIYALRRPGSGVDALILWGDLAQLLAFALLVSRALLLRRVPAEHKRLMLLATAVIVLPALARWPFDFMQKGPPIGIVALYFTVPVALAIYDLVTLKRIHRATLLGTVLIALIIGTTLTVSSTAWWQAIAARVQRG
jgi:hypothetical protein